MIGNHPSTKKQFFWALLNTYSFFLATVLFSLLVNKLANLVPNTFGPLPLLISYIGWKGKSVLPPPLPPPTQPKDGSISNERGGREKKKQIWPKGQKDPDHRSPLSFPIFGGGAHAKNVWLFGDSLAPNWRNFCYFFKKRFLSCHKRHSSIFYHCHHRLLLPIYLILFGLPIPALLPWAREEGRKGGIGFSLSTLTVMLVLAASVAYWLKRKEGRKEWCYNCSGLPASLPSPLPSAHFAQTRTHLLFFFSKERTYGEAIAGVWI